MKTIIRKLVVFFFLLSLLSQSLRFESVNAQSQEPPKRKMTGGMRMVERNLYAPELYAEKLKMVIALVDLPGAQSPDSSIEVSYQIRFIPESESRKFMQQMMNKSKAEPSASTSKLELPEPVSDILLAEGKFNKTGLGSLTNRTFVQDNIVFKSKIPDKMRTKFS